MCACAADYPAVLWNIQLQPKRKRHRRIPSRTHPHSGESLVSNILLSTPAMRGAFVPAALHVLFQALHAPLKFSNSQVCTTVPRWCSPKNALLKMLFQKPLESIKGVLHCQLCGLCSPMWSPSPGHRPPPVLRQAPPSP